MLHFPMSTPIELSTLCEELKGKCHPSNASDLVKREWEEPRLKNREHVTEFDKRFRRLH